MTHVRPAAVADLPELAALAAVTFPLACPPRTTPADAAAYVAAHLTEANFTSYLDDPARRVLVATADDELTGYVMLVLGEPTDPDVSAALSLRPTVEISKFYVAPDAHGGATASALMAAALRTATEVGASGVWLGVNEENERAIRFYAKSGFAAVGRKTFQLAGRLESDHVLERPVCGVG